ncbi:MAG: ABC transporter substrate-binding protein [Alphaproteobacteria bacterium]|nr:ABC transporter substrate-binding protein [Alphaproteobacteria bacterium]
MRLEVRWNGSDAERAQASAHELIGLSPSVILSCNSIASEAFRKNANTIPIVFTTASDPVGSGLVRSLARPGGNITGFANFDFSMGGKWLETIQEVSPDVRRVLVVTQPGNIGSQGLVEAVEAAAPALHAQLIITTAFDTPEIERAINDFAREPNGGLLVLPGAATGRRDLIVRLAMQHRLPAMYTLRPFIASGGLMSYDVNLVDHYRRAAAYIDRILKGEKPAELPVLNTTKFKLTINLKTARAIGLNVPLTLLARADELIE